MFSITVPASAPTEYYDERTQEFIEIEGTPEFTLELEHSLASISKWESVEEKAFLGTQKHTAEDTMSYIKAMTITPDVPPEIYERLSPANVSDVVAYIDGNHTATMFNEIKTNTPASKEVITAEIIYYWMFSFNIPAEFEHWHLNKLLTLIKVTNIKNNPKKSTAAKTTAAQRKAINDQRRAALGTTG